MPIVIILIIALVGCATPQKEPACGFKQDKFGQRVSWNFDLPLVLYFGPEISDDMVSVFKLAMQDWNRAAGRDLIRYGGRTAAAFQQNKVDTVHLTNDWQFEKVQTAVTRIYYEGEQLTEADIILNGEHRKYYTGTDMPAFDEMDTYSLALHELGHSIGLVHSDDTNSVMYPYLYSGQVIRTITPQDKNNLFCEY